MAEVDEQRLVEDAKRIAARFQALLIDSARVGVDPMPLLDGVQRELGKARWLERGLHAARSATSGGRSQPLPKAFAAPAASSSGVTSRTRWAMFQRCPNGSTTWPWRSPQN
jgi:hypothetical protein